jgi:tRNA-splicing ligase RtcB
MKKREMINLGMPSKACKTAVKACIALAQSGCKKEDVRRNIKMVLEDPGLHVNDGILGELAATLLNLEKVSDFVERDQLAPWKQWGEDLDEGSITQLNNACRLPVAVAGALMPDAHLGYGLPIGGVLATENSIIPYAVGVDIACRMKLSVFDLPVHKMLSGQNEKLAKAIESETRFGIGAFFEKPRDHDVMDEDWNITEVTQQCKDKAWKQLGSSGSGNHFCEFGVLTLANDELGLEAGEYLALMTHSGSRGAGAKVAGHYSKIAQQIRHYLPKELLHLSWLNMDSEAGYEYWNAMQLMGKYAAANHACIHRHIAKKLGAKVIADVENHHNFAWREEHMGKTVYVHRKGATPAGQGVLGVIPGSMADPAYIVKGKGNPDSLNSASHGAGRVMSRRKAHESFTWHAAKKLLKDRGVTLLSAGLDEVPMVYKNIDDVMDAQKDLVEVLAKFDPKIVKMAPAGEKAED